MGVLWRLLGEVMRFFCDGIHIFKLHPVGNSYVVDFPSSDLLGSCSLLSSLEDEPLEGKPPLERKVDDEDGPHQIYQLRNTRHGADMIAGVQSFLDDLRHFNASFLFPCISGRFAQKTLSSMALT